jgi:hypothetical protein
LLLVLGGVLLTACRLDVGVAVDMAPDGSGVVTLDAVADAELVSKVPDLAGDLRLDDAIANGWQVDGPAPLEGGGLSIRLTRAFSTAADLTAILNSIGPPLEGAVVTRRQDAGESPDQVGPTTNLLDGSLVLADGYASFADSDLIAAVGGQPFGDELAASGLTPDQAISFTLRASLPGELVSAPTGRDVGNDTIEWKAPLDGTSISLLTQTEQRPPGTGAGWARPIATVSKVLLVAWLMLSLAFIGFVAYARQSKRRRRERALRNLRSAPRR